MFEVEADADEIVVCDQALALGGFSSASSARSVDFLRHLKIRCREGASYKFVVHPVHCVSFRIPSEGSFFVTFVPSWFNKKVTWMFAASAASSLMNYAG